jgi:4-amino-4-deoxy-L-arabinose transferase-like glycosyltransferase/tetratricopeptide (TPR) repeat protein
MEQTQPRPILLLSGLFLTALAIRGIYFIELSHLPYFDVVLNVYDHFNFDQGALNFAAGDILARSPNNSYSPLYKYFLGTIYYLFGRNFYVVYGLQFVLGALGAVLIFLSGKRLFDARVGFLAFAGFSLYSTEIIYEGIILRAAFITFLAILSFYMLIRLRESPTSLMLIGCALVLSLFFQSRPNTFLCLPFVVFYIHKYVFKDWRMEERVRGWAIFLIPLFLSFVPLLVQCYLVHGKFVFFDSSGPTAFMAGNFIDYPGVGFDSNLLTHFQKKYQMEDLSPASFIFQQVISDPVGFLKMIGRKLFYFLNDLEGASNLSTYIYLENSRILPFLLSHFSLFSALGIMGVALAIQSKEKVFLLYSYLLCMVLSVVLFHVVARFRIPSAPFLILFAAYAVGRVCTWWGQKRFKSIAVFTIVFLGLFYGLRVPENHTKIRFVDHCNWSYSYLIDEKWFDVDEAETYGIKCLESERRINAGWGMSNVTLASIYKLYGSYLIQKKDEATGDILKNAFSIDPFDSELYRMYANFEMGRNKTESAVRHLHISRIVDQKDVTPIKNLIRFYYQNNGDPGRLLTALKTVLSEERDPKILQNVKNEIRRLEVLLSSKTSWVKISAEKARKYFSEGNWSAALEEYKLLNRFNASDSSLLVEQGMVYENLKNKEKALDSFYDALLVKWENPELDKNLGNYYLSSGNLALAIIHWKRYLETSTRQGEYFLIQKKYRYFSKKLRMKDLKKQIFDLSEEQTHVLYKIYKNMNVGLAP